MRSNTGYQFFKLVIIVSIAILLLSSCNFPLFNNSSASTAGATTEPPATLAISATQIATASSEAASNGGSCLVGRWVMDDYSAYFRSFNNMFPDSTDASITNNSVTGTSIFEFGADGTGTFVADNFNQSYTMTINVNGNVIEIPMSILINGTARSRFTIEGDEISFHDQDAGDAIIDITIMGNTTRVDNNLMGDPGTIKLYKYSCIDANTLSLKVVAVDSDLAPITLTRIP